MDCALCYDVLHGTEFRSCPNRASKDPICNVPYTLNILIPTPLILFCLKFLLAKKGQGPTTVKSHLSCGIMGALSQREEKKKNCVSGIIIRPIACDTWFHNMVESHIGLVVVWFGQGPLYGHLRRRQVIDLPCTLVLMSTLYRVPLCTWGNQAAYKNMRTPPSPPRGPFFSVTLFFNGCALGSSWGEVCTPWR